MGFQSLAFFTPSTVFRIRFPPATERRYTYTRNFHGTCGRSVNANIRGCTNSTHFRTWTRRFALRTLGFLVLPINVNAVEKRAFPGDAIRCGRNRLDDVDALIDAASWDRVRTVLRSGPILDAQDAVKALAASSSEELQFAWYGFREEMIGASKRLDFAVYSNGYSGDSVDYETPKLYLQQLKDAYDGLVELSEQE